MPAYVEWAKRTFNVLALLSKTVTYFLLDTITLIPLIFPFLLTETSLSLRVYTADITSL